jgi:hypothetical protein
MRDRGGWTILVLLISMLIVGFLVTKQAKIMLPGKDGKAAGQQALPDKARVETFRMTAMIVRNAVAAHEAQTGKKITSWDEVLQLGIQGVRQDPWGGKYYVKNGAIRCTGNAQVSERLN